MSLTHSDMTRRTWNRTKNVESISVAAAARIVVAVGVNGVVAATVGKVAGETLRLRRPGTRTLYSMNKTTRRTLYVAVVRVRWELRLF